MPLKDRFETSVRQRDGGWEFACDDQDGRRVAVRVTQEAVEDTAPAGLGDQTKFEGNRATYLRIASDKFDMASSTNTQPIVVTNYDIQAYEHR